MFCAKCGKQLTGTGSFCPRCGSRVQQQAPYLNATPPPPAQPGTYVSPGTYRQKIFTPQDWKIALLVGIITSVVVIILAFLLVALLNSGDNSLSQAVPSTIGPGAVAFGLFRYR